MTSNEFPNNYKEKGFESYFKSKMASKAYSPQNHHEGPILKIINFSTPKNQPNSIILQILGCGTALRFL